MPARLGRTFTLINLGLLAQPATHALSKLAHAGAEAFPHSDAVPDDLWAVALQVAVSVLNVLVAGSEPSSSSSPRTPYRICGCSSGG